MRLEFDATLRSRVVARQGDSFEPLTDFEPSETLRLADGKRIDRFAFRDQRSEGVNDGHGRGTRHVLRGLADEGIEKEISIVLYDRFPGFALLSVAYRNIARNTGQHRRLGEWRPCPQAGAVAGALEYWSFSGASYEDRRDWVQPVSAGFDQRNFMGMNASDYGGGTPVVDVWRRDLRAGGRPCRNSAEAPRAAAHDDGGRCAHRGRMRSRGRRWRRARAFRPSRPSWPFIAAIISRRSTPIAASSPSAGWRRRRCPRPPMSRSGVPGAMSVISPSIRWWVRCPRRESSGSAGRCSTTAGRPRSATGTSTRPSSRAATPT